MAYKNATNSDECFSLGVGTTDKQNNNPTYLQKHILKWHCRLVHLELQQLQWITRNNSQEKFASNYGRTNVIPPNYASFMYDKQDKAPKKGATI